MSTSIVCGSGVWVPHEGRGRVYELFNDGSVAVAFDFGAFMEFRRLPRTVTRPTGRVLGSQPAPMPPIWVLP